MFLPVPPRAGTAAGKPSYAVLSVPFSLVLLALLASPAGAQFADVASGNLADTGAGFGAAWGDYDKDGDPDLFLSNGSGNSKLFRNDNGVFVDVTPPPLAGDGGEFGAAWGDYDNDGYPDIFIANGASASELCRNEGGGVFSPVNGGDATAPGPAQSPAWADYDRDGDLDLYVTFWEAPNRLLRNDGGGNFVDVATGALADSGKGTGVAWGDYDNDGDLDLFVGARLGGRLFRNDGGDTFVEVTVLDMQKAGITGAAWGDYDNDGDLDLYMSRDLLSNRLLRNDSSGGVTAFTDLYIPAVRDEGISQGVVWFDYDNDMDLDLFVTNAGSDNGSGDSNRLVKNTGGGSFSQVLTSPEVNHVANSRGAAAGDFDRDGFLDLYVVNWFGPNQLLRKLPNGNRWIEIRLVGVESNTAAIGARVRVVAGGVSQIREISGGSGLYSQDSFVAHFGLGPHTVVDTVEVRWPSGIVTDTTSVPAGQLMTILESEQVTGVRDPLPPGVRLLANAPNPFRTSTVIRYELSEPSPVDLRILDVRGRLVRHLERTPQKEPGLHEHSWNGRDDSGRRLAEGVYFYTLDTRNGRQSRRMVLLR